MMKTKDPYAALRSGDFRLFLTAKFMLTVALQMQAVVAGWIIYQQTKDPFSLGLIGLTEAIPALSLALPGGLLADRYNRRMLVILSCFVMLLASVAFVLYMLGDFTSEGLWPVYAIIFCIGLARGIFTPAQSALWGQVIHPENYVNGSVWNSSLWQIGAVAGPAAGGLCFAWLGSAMTLSIVCVLVLIALVSYMLMSAIPTSHHDKNESITESLKNGIQFFFQNRTLLSAVSLDLFAVLFGGAVALLPAFADDVLKCGPEGLGYLRSAPAIGAVIMATWLAFRPPAKGAGQMMLWCVGGFGICMIAFALSGTFWISMMVLIFSGMLDNVSVVIRSTILQTLTPNEMRGRVAAVNSIFVGSSNEIGAFESGLAARILGLIPSVVFGGCMTLLAVGITAKTSPTLRKLNL